MVGIQPAVHRRVGLYHIGRIPGNLDLGPIVQVPQVLRHLEWIVRAVKRDDQEERIVVALISSHAPRVQVFERPELCFLVVGQELRPLGHADVGQTIAVGVLPAIDNPVLACTAMRGRPRKAGRVDVCSQPPAQAVQLIRPRIVHFAASHGIVSGQGQGMGQGRIVGTKRRGIIPHLVVADVGTGHQRRPRRRTQRAGRVGRIKAHATLDQPVQAWRLDHWVPIGAHQKRHQLIGHNEQYVGSVIHRLSSTRCSSVRIQMPCRKRF